MQNTIQIGIQNGKYVGTYFGGHALKMRFMFGTDRIAAFLNGADDLKLAHYATDYAVEIDWLTPGVIA